MSHGYTDEERRRLHNALREVLEETVRVCGELRIRYFMVGGSLIGCHFWDDIDPFDDDIDIGMTRPEYERFLSEAPSRLRPGFILQWFGNTPETPFYFAKIRKEGTLFVEEATRKLNMQQGIYVDIFPFDRIPDDPKRRRRQRKLANTLNSCFISKSVWRYRHFGRCEVEEPCKHSILSCLLDRLAVTFVPKKTLFRLLTAVQTRYNHTETTYCNIVLTDVDQLRVASLNNLQATKFGRINVLVPRNYEEYLRHHYPNLRKHLSKEEIDKFSHRPVKLSFGDGADSSQPQPASPNPPEPKAGNDQDKERNNE